MSNLRKFPDKEIIEEVAIELGIAPSFIEKDWYAVQVIDIISSFKPYNIIPIFSGGTSLSKGYKLIKRFSEDIDFKIKTSSDDIKRALRRKFRENIIEQINSSKTLEVIRDSIDSKNESHFFSFSITYPQIFSLHASLRPTLKLEMTFQDVQLPTNGCNISSLISEYLHNEAETSIDCVSLLETAADKLSALLWRMEIKDRSEKMGSVKNDPTIIRHLYDLHALKEHILNDFHFIEIVVKAINNDIGRGGSDRQLSVQEKIYFSLLQLRDDRKYKDEYESFVDAMFYGPDNERIDFYTACQSYQEITEFILSQDLKQLPQKNM